MQPLTVTALKLVVTASLPPQLSVAEGAPNAAMMSAAAGLQPSIGVAPVTVTVGGVTLVVQVTVFVWLAVLPRKHPWRMKVQLCVAVQPLTVTALKLVVTASLPPQLSVAEGAPNAAMMSAAAGLQPSIGVVPVTVTVGGVTLVVQVTVFVWLAVLPPQASVALKVQLCVAVQPLTVTALKLVVTASLPPQ